MRAELPAEVVDFAGEGPEFGYGDEGFADGVLADVQQFFAVFFGGAEAAVECGALPAPVVVCVLAGELGFPVGDPFFDGETEIARGAKEVDGIGHEDVIANKPGVGGAPNGDEGIMNRFGGEPVAGRMAQMVTKRMVGWLGSILTDCGGVWRPMCGVCGLGDIAGEV